MMKAADFDSFAYACPLFTNEPWVINGYGCSHPEQEENVKIVKVKKADAAIAGLAL